MDSGRPESVTQGRPYRKKCFAKIALAYKGITEFYTVPA